LILSECQQQPRREAAGFTDCVALPFDSKSGLTECLPHPDCRAFVSEKLVLALEPSLTLKPAVFVKNSTSPLVLNGNKLAGKRGRPFVILVRLFIAYPNTSRQNRKMLRSKRLWDRLLLKEILVGLRSANQDCISPLH